MRHKENIYNFQLKSKSSKISFNSSKANTNQKENI